MDAHDTYSELLNLATDAGHAELKFWRRVVPLADQGLDVGTIARLIGRTSVMGKTPSRATVYRRLDQWREVLADLDNPGRGA